MRFLMFLKVNIVNNYNHVTNKMHAAVFALVVKLVELDVLVNVFHCSSAVQPDL